MSVVVDNSSINGMDFGLCLNCYYKAGIFCGKDNYVYLDVVNVSC